MERVMGIEPIVSAACKSLINIAILASHALLGR